MNTKDIGRMTKSIYLCGPINGRTTEDATNWRELAKSHWLGDCIDPMRRDYRGREMEPGIAAEIVAGDLVDIQEASALLVFFDKPSVGTAMEVFYAHHVLQKPVIVVFAAQGQPSPWLVYHCYGLVSTVEEGLAALDELLGGGLVSQHVIDMCPTGCAAD